MRHVLTRWACRVSLALPLLTACAGIEAPAGPGIMDPDPVTKVIDVGCASSITESVDPVTSTHTGWQLTVDPDEIVSEEPFTANISAEVGFDENDIASAQLLIPGGFEWASILEMQATVRVRKGAAGDAVVLVPEDHAIPYLCTLDKTPCDSGNDLPGTPGMRGNADCQPVADDNPCARFAEIPTSDDCDPEGLCDELGWTEQCEENGFCNTGPVTIPLEAQLKAYEADSSGSVLFGFDDQNTEIRQEGGCNDGTWVRHKPKFTDPLGPSGFRMRITSVPVAVECIMGVNGRGPDGVDSCDPLLSPSPDHRLISFPIQTP